MRGRRIALALALLGAAVALSGCGVSKVIDPVAAAATKTENAGGAKLTMSIAVTDPSASKTFTLTAQGVFDKDQADITMDLSNLLAGSGLSGSGDVELRYLQENGDPVMYMNIPFLATMLPGGKSWIKLDLEQAGKSLGLDLNQLMNESEQNPTQTLDLLRAAGSVTTVGTEAIDGVATTHYTATVDLAKAAALEGAAGEALVKRLTAAGAPSQIPVDVWIGNDDGLVHKLTVNEQVKSNGVDVGASITLNISDYGLGVSVVAPSADQVFDITGLASTLGSLAPPATA